MANVACVMMQKDEDELLPSWLAYHGRLFGSENIFLFDNGSTSSGVADCLRNACSQGTQVDWSFDESADYQKKGQIIGEKISELDKRGVYDYLVPLDCDEYFVLRDGESGIICDVDRIHEALSNLRDDRAFCTEVGFYNNLADRDRYWKWEHRKTFFGANSFEYLDHGHHNGRSRKQKGFCQTEFAYMHLHHKPYETRVQHARNLLTPYINVDDQAELEQFRGNGYHVVKYLLKPREEYDERFKQGAGILLPEFPRYLESLGVEFPFG